MINYWVLKGEQSTWSQLPLVWNRCAIELALDKGKGGAPRRAAMAAAADARE